MQKRITTFGIKTTLVEVRDFASLATRFSTDHNQSASALFCNVHMLMLAQEDPLLAEAMQNADWVFADSAPVAWLQRRVSGKSAKVIPGFEILLAICSLAIQNDENIGFIGSTPEVMSQLVINLKNRFNGLSISYQYFPPFMEGELILNQQEIQNLKDSDIKYLFVGLGCPKQEKWILKYADEIQCNIFGIGAAFDWFSGLTSKPPEWMERFALAWIYRLIQDPIRLSHRYLKYNTKFIFKVIGSVPIKK